MRYDQHLLPSCILAVACGAGTPAAAPGSNNAGRAEDSSQDEARSIRVEFLLDESLTRGVYMGERWVSPPTYSVVHTGPTATVTMRARALDARGAARAISLEWSASDPKVVAISAAVERVHLRVLGPGQSSLTISGAGVTKRLEVLATLRGDGLHLEIAQTAP